MLGNRAKSVTKYYHQYMAQSSTRVLDDISLYSLIGFNSEHIHNQRSQKEKSEKKDHIAYGS